MNNIVDGRDGRTDLLVTVASLYYELNQNQQQIADRLFLSEGTVRNHLTIIYEKVGVSDRFGLIIFASQHGLEARQ